MEETYQLEKQIWTERDFDVMGWHDSNIHAICFSQLKEYKLVFDIDYIFNWMHPLEGETYFKFWIAPCTLIFENVYNLVFDFETPLYEFTISEITKNSPQLPQNAEYKENETEYNWVIDTFNGEISFKSTGYKQYVRQQPKLVTEQELDFESRGGISFNSKFI